MCVRTTDEEIQGPINIYFKKFQLHSFLRKCKLKPQYDTISLYLTGRKNKKLLTRAPGSSVG